MRKIAALLALSLFLVSACSGSQDNITSTTTLETDTTTTTVPSGPVEGLEIGDIAPDVILIAMDGTKHKLSDYRGQVVLLNFWATWCGYCKEEMPMMQELHEKYKDKGLAVLAVDVRETEEDVYKYLDEVELEEGVRLTFPIYMDKRGEVYEKFNISGGIPQTYIIDQNGIIQRYIPGTFARIASAAALKGILVELLGVKK